jgi:hypothetical protein
MGADAFEMVQALFYLYSPANRDRAAFVHYIGNTRVVILPGVVYHRPNIAGLLNFGIGGHETGA